MKRHLTREDYSKWLIGEKTAEHEVHLQSCADCAAELETMQAPLALFRGAVRDWSAKERTNSAAEQYNRSLAEPAHVQHSPLWARVATAGAALALAMAIGIGGMNWRESGESTKAAHTEQEDEALLGNIQAKVMRPVPASMQPVYNLMTQQNAARNATAEDAK